MKHHEKMTRLSARESGLPFDIWVYGAAAPIKTKRNGIRFKASCHGVTVTAGFLRGVYTTFQTSTTDLKKFGWENELEAYAMRIKSLLELHWDEKIDDWAFLYVAKLRAGKRPSRF